MQQSTHRQSNIMNPGQTMTEDPHTQTGSGVKSKESACTYIHNPTDEAYARQGGFILLFSIKHR